MRDRIRLLTYEKVHRHGRIGLSGHDEAVPSVRPRLQQGTDLAGATEAGLVEHEPDGRAAMPLPQIEMRTEPGTSSSPRW